MNCVVFDIDCYSCEYFNYRNSILTLNKNEIGQNTIKKFNKWNYFLEYHTVNWHWKWISYTYTFINFINYRFHFDIELRFHQVKESHRKSISSIHLFDGGLQPLHVLYAQKCTNRRMNFVIFKLYMINKWNSCIDS